jgi:hypothetical protein
LIVWIVWRTKFWNLILKILSELGKNVRNMGEYAGIIGIQCKESFVQPEQFESHILGKIEA